MNYLINNFTPIVEVDGDFRPKKMGDIQMGRKMGAEPAVVHLKTGLV